MRKQILALGFIPHILIMDLKLPPCFQTHNLCRRGRFDRKYVIQLVFREDWIRGIDKKKYLIAARVDVVCLIFNCECEIVVNEVVEEVMHELRS